MKRLYFCLIVALFLSACSHREGKRVGRCIDSYYPGFEAFEQEMLGKEITWEQIDDDHLIILLENDTTILQKNGIAWPLFETFVYEEKSMFVKATLFRNKELKMDVWARGIYMGSMRFEAIQ